MSGLARMTGWAAAVAVVLTLPSAAMAWSHGEDLAVAQQTLPVGHPCRAGVEVRWVPNLVGQDGREAEAMAPQGRLVDGRWMAETVDGGVTAMPCDELLIDPADWDLLPACQRRRLVLHELGHMAGHKHAEGGLMSQDERVRDRVAVPGCPAVRVGVLERAADRLLGLLPVGWGVSCGRTRRSGVIGCSASRGRAERRYRVLVRGSRLFVRRVAR